MEQFFRAMPYFWAAVQHRAEFQRIAEIIKPGWILLQPAIAYFKPHMQELYQLGMNLAAEIFPQFRLQLTSGRPLFAFNVTTLQEELNKRGEKIPVDGDYGEATAEAVKRYQLANHLTVDGYAGDETITFMIAHPVAAVAVK